MRTDPIAVIDADPRVCVCGHRLTYHPSGQHCLTAPDKKPGKRWAASICPCAAFTPVKST